MSITDNDILYTKSGNELIVGTDKQVDNNALVNNEKTCVILPTFVSGIPVRTIGQYAFRHSTSLIRAQISRTIRSIGFDAFAYIPTLFEVSFDPQSELKTIGQGFLFQCGVKNVFIPPKVSSIGKYFLGANSAEDLLYCNNREANYALLFECTGTYYEPKRIHVLSSYKYQKVGDFTNLLKDGLCERMLFDKTCKIHKSDSICFKCGIICVIFYNK